VDAQPRVHGQAVGTPLLHVVLHRQVRLQVLVRRSHRTDQVRQAPRHRPLGGGLEQQPAPAAAQVRRGQPRLEQGDRRGPGAAPTPGEGTGEHPVPPGRRQVRVAQVPGEGHRVDLAHGHARVVERDELPLREDLGQAGEQLDAVGVVAHELRPRLRQVPQRGDQVRTLGEVDDVHARHARTTALQGSRPCGRSVLDQVPPVAEGVREDGDPPVGLRARLLGEGHARRTQAGVVGREVVRVQEEAHAATGLVTDAGPLVLVGGERQQERPPAAAGATTTQRLPAVSCVSSTSSKPSEPTK
jgi:hypothetical protein